MSVNPLYVAFALAVIIGVIGYVQSKEILPAAIGAAVAFLVVWLGGRFLVRKKS